MRYFILGSCITRDVFRVSQKDSEVVDYYARTKLKSLISNPIDINDINLKSNFQKRIVKRDLEKTFFNDIKNEKFDYLIIDLIDERFNIVKVQDSFVTKSNEFVNAGLYNMATPISYALDEWESDCKEFSKRLIDVISPNKIFIHEVYWANQYIEDGKIKKYDNQKNIELNNSTLKEYYKTLKKYLPDVKIISCSDVIGDAHHLWGLSPVHYTDEYYKKIYNDIEASIPKIKRFYDWIKTMLSSQ
ncbi:hypothetical protein FDC58_18175 [Clostridium botulinum]|uniref:DUF6270 domain-containing protein n=1 Tax=unclassified Clostridium TaxID=2614128 RepID=UPI0006898F5D|nr:MULTISPECIES: DUF6270 domain-containing protein [unclassified Clostridium]MBY6802848.1 hypothetical protein [Clostridium botulinum]MBY6812967.1 hypothetical protein [Clostridium botulinum]MBY6818906.1 hypothetical protein [Clostridium botulinum]MBY7008509.1 hypothetical protein [Clostridium botulinum]NFH74489.1 hypothetical protein [Clostridium botulinum]